LSISVAFLFAPPINLWEGFVIDSVSVEGRKETPAISNTLLRYTDKLVAIAVIGESSTNERHIKKRISHKKTEKK
jgi:hypothetical protein